MLVVVREIWELFVYLGKGYFIGISDSHTKIYINCIQAIYRSIVKALVELTTNDPWSADDAICEGISPLGYLQKVDQSPTQTKPYNTLPPFEPRDSWSSYGAVRAYSEFRL